MIEDKELEELLKEIPELEEIEEDNYDNLSSGYCSFCGARLSVNEYEEFEDACYECIHEQTSGLINDNVEDELNF